MQAIGSGLLEVRAMLKRILWPLFVIILILAVIILLIMHGGGILHVLQSGQNIVSPILSLLQLAGILFIVALVIIILVQYAQYIRPNRFIFEGFSNTSKLVDFEGMPLDLNILAREQLIAQFKNLNNEWRELSGAESSEADARFTDELFFGKTIERLDMKNYIPIGLAENKQAFEELQDIINDIKDSEGINLMALAEEIAPKEVTPIMKFLEAVFPPHIIRATGYLQWWSDNKKRAGGITFEFVDLGGQRNLMVRTIWWQPEEAGVTDPGTQSSAEFRVDTFGEKELITNQHQTTIFEDDKKSQVTERYIDLLNPAMHWLALMFWKQKMISHIPIQNYIFKSQERRRQAQILYLFGALYYACAHQYQANHDFFCQLAIEQFRQALAIDPKWYSPYFYLADLYSFKMQDRRNDATRKKQLFEQAIGLYQKALKCAEGTKGDEYSWHRIIVVKALAELISEYQDYIPTAVKEIENSINKMDPAKFDPERPDCATYLYTLAYWYAYAARQYPILIPSFDTSRQYARRYVAYCLARSHNLWDMVSNNEDFQKGCDEDWLPGLKTVLEDRLKNDPQLAKLRGDRFRRAIDDILSKVQI